jgi:hypothetical protein
MEQVLMNLLRFVLLILEKIVWRCLAVDIVVGGIE